MKNLQDMTPAELDGLIQDANKLKADAEKRQKKECKAAVEKVLSEYGYSLEDVYPRLAGGGKKPKPKGEAKFRNPETGEEWTGQGRRPKWLVEAEKAGKSRDDFAV